MSDKEIRSVEGAKVEVREAESPTLTGYAALYGSETTIAGMFREVIQPGAFKAAIGRDDVRALYNHDPNFVLGRTKSGTLKLTEDAHGLRYDVVLPNTLAAKDLHEQIKRGDISQSSFAFRVVKDSWPSVRSGEMPLRQIEDVELFDVSPVTYPAYEDTSVSARAKETAAFQSSESAEAVANAIDEVHVHSDRALFSEFVREDAAIAKRKNDLMRREWELRSI